MLEIILKNREDCLLKSYRDKHATCKGIRPTVYMYLGRKEGREVKKGKEKEDGEDATHQWRSMVGKNYSCCFFFTY